LEDILYQLFDDFVRGRQERRFVVRFTQLQDGVQVGSPMGHVLTHAQEKAIQRVT